MNSAVVSIEVTIEDIDHSGKEKKVLGVGTVRDDRGRIAFDFWLKISRWHWTGSHAATA